MSRGRDYEYTLDRAGNARRLVDLHQDKIMYVPEAKAWFVWDGKRWSEDSSLLVLAVDDD